MKQFKKLSVIVMAVCLGILSIFAMIKEKETYSDSERRVLAKFPEISIDSVLEGKFTSQFDEYTTDTFPYRDLFRSIKANVVKYVFQQKDNNNLYQVGNHLAKMEYEISLPMVEHATKLFTKIYDEYLSNQNVYFSLIPDKHHYLANQYGYLSYEFKEMEELIQAQLPFVKMISIDHLLDENDYYDTDSHWKQNAVIDVAKYIANQMGKSLNDEYEVNTLDKDFYGVYYGQAALNVKPDTIEYVTNDTIQQLIVEGANAVYDEEKLNGKDAYEFFLSGNQPIVTITNSLLQDGSRLIVFRDSYASSLMPLLAESYSEIVLVDLRYIGSDLLKDYVDFSNADILFLYSATMMNSSMALK